MAIEVNIGCDEIGDSGQWEPVDPTSCDGEGIECTLCHATITVFYHRNNWKISGMCRKTGTGFNRKIQKIDVRGI